MTTQHGLGRLFTPDTRDTGYLMRRLLAPPSTPIPTRKTWPFRIVPYDQGSTGTCVGHAWTHFLACAPMQTVKGVATPYELYREIVKIDEWAENDAEATGPDSGLQFGTSVRAGAEALKTRGHLGSYLWAFNLREAVEWVLTRGPVVMGTNWYDSMMNVNAEGYVKISGSVSGGHAWLLRGVNNKQGIAECVNSWGDRWGVNQKGKIERPRGHFLITLEDLERLIHENGEACSTVETKLKAKVVA